MNLTTFLPVSTSTSFCIFGRYFTSASVVSMFGRLERLQHGREVRRVAGDLEHVALALQVLGPGVEGERHQRVLVRVLGRVDGEEALAVEHVRRRDPGTPRLPPARSKIFLTSPLVRLRLSVRTSTRTATPPGP